MSTVSLQVGNDGITVLNCRPQSGILIKSGILSLGKFSNARKTEFFDFENTNSYCPLNKEGPQVRGASGGVIKTPEGNKPMVCGGYNSASQSIPGCYFLGEGTPTQNLREGLSFHAGAVVGDGSFLWVTGGQRGTAGGHAVVETTDLISWEECKNGPNLPKTLHYHAMVVLDSKTVMVVGGHTGHRGSTDAYIYDLTNPINPQLQPTPRPQLTQVKY